MPEEAQSRLFIGGLKREVEKDEVEAVFSEFGELVDTWIAYDPPGFAFVEFKTNEAAAAAITALHKTEQFGSEIRVEVTKPRHNQSNKYDKKEEEIKARLFVGDIKESIEKEQLTAEFQRFGAIADVWIAHNPPGFAFVEFEKMCDAEDAIKEMHESELFGGKIRVQLTKGRKPDRSERFNKPDRVPWLPMRGRRVSTPYERPVHERRPPPAHYDEYDRYDDPYRRPLPRAAPRYARDPYARDPYAPPPRRLPPRDPYARDPYERDPYDDPYYPAPRREPYPYDDPYAAPPRRAPRPYSADPYSHEEPPVRRAADPYAADPYAVKTLAAKDDPYSAMRGNTIDPKDPYAAE